MSHSHGTPERGDSVRIRDERWRVTGVSRYESCVVLDCAGQDSSNQGATAHFILPFEQLDRLPAVQRPRLVRPAVWRRVAARALAAATPEWRSLRAAAGAAIALLPYQLEPALAMTRGLGCRFLLADDVGLGKTIQAGLVVAELLARERDARVLIVTPAGLRDQWREELRERFSIEAAVVDAAALVRTAANLPPDVNPWTMAAVAIASIDFLKRADVIRSLEPLTWDLIAFDEAHALSGRSDRALAAELLAARARRIVIITATPHNGDEAAFDRLRRLGQLHGDPLLTFRRSRWSAGIHRARVVRRMSIAPTRAEARMHRALSAYAARVERESSAAGGAGARLAVIVLQRRAASSAASLARSVERRMALLAAAPVPAPAQIRLPLDDGRIDDDEEPSEELGSPGLIDAGAEARWLGRILGLARAVNQESKVARLQRLLSRIDEPVLVFTEYRDTLRHVASALNADCAIVHGALEAAERSLEIRRFTHGAARVLLATDAASEGVNLHRRCRLVVNFDVPWTPLRLEQRVGRVDRLGQSRTVHAVTFVGSGTADPEVASRLTVRAARADREAPFAAESWLGLRADASAEAARLEHVRGLGARPSSRNLPARPVMTMLRRGRRGSALLVLQFAFVDAAGVLAWQTVAGLMLDADSASIPGAARVRAWLEAALERRWMAVAAAAADLHERRLEAARAEVAAATAPLLARERAMLERIGSERARLAAPLVQPGLFDRRALRDREAQQRVAAEAAARSLARVAALDRLQNLDAGSRILLCAAAWPR